MTLEDRIKNLEQKVNALEKGIEKDYPEIELPVKEKWKWVAMDYSRIIYIFTEKPYIDNDYYWFGDGDIQLYPETFIDIPKSVIKSNWKESLHKIKHV